MSFGKKLSSVDISQKMRIDHTFYAAGYHGSINIGEKRHENASEK